MRTANVFPILKAVKPVLCTAIREQGFNPTKFNAKSTRTGKITIEIIVEEFIPAQDKGK